MTEPRAPAKHPFLDDLAADVVLTSSVLAAPVVGREEVRRVVREVSGLYTAQRPLARDVLGSRSVLEYEADLVGGHTVRGLVVMDRDAEGDVSAISINFSPFHGVVSIAARLGIMPDTEGTAAP